MREHWKRLGTLVRKDGKVLARSLPSMLLLLVLLCVGCVSLCFTTIESARKIEDKLTIGVVDLDGTMASKLAIGMVTGNEEIGALFEVQDFQTPDEAYDAIARGETVAAVIFEEGYLSKIGRGESSPISVVLSREMEMHTQMIREFADTGEILLKTGQYGADAAWKPIHDVYTDDFDAVVKFNFFATKYAIQMLALTGEAAEHCLLPYSDRAASLENHYILYYTVLLLTLLDMLFFDFVRRDNSRTLLCRLKSAGVGSGHILLAKVPFLLIAKAVLLLLVLVAVSFFTPVTVTFLSLLGALCALVFSGFIGVGLCLLLQRSNVGPCILCALAFAGLFLCGGLVPYDMLPETITFWGRFTHMGTAAALLSPMLGGTVTVWNYVTAAVMLAAVVVGGLWFTDRLRTKGSDHA